MSFAETVAAAIRDFAENGYSSEAQLEYWLDQIRRATEQEALNKHRMEDMLRDALKAIYARMIEKQGILKYNKDVDRFTVQRLAPRLRLELDRRILASANLIKLNRKEAIEKTLRRFSGWASSQPEGGSAEPERRKAAEEVKKSIKQLPWQERRVIVDQTHKFNASLSEIIAVNGGAIAGRWTSHFRQRGYDYREDHKERDGNYYLIKGNWASEKGYVKPSPVGWYDDITHVGQEVNCRCFMVWSYSLRSMPEDMLTEKGKEALIKAKAEVARMRA